jgi:hypothetical protein
MDPPENDTIGTGTQLLTYNPTSPQYRIMSNPEIESKDDYYFAFNHNYGSIQLKPGRNTISIGDCILCGEGCFYSNKKPLRMCYDCRRPLRSVLAKTFALIRQKTCRDIAKKIFREFL